MSIKTVASWRTYALPLALLFQIGILVGMVLLAMRPLVEGREVRFQVESRDPRDVFRGDYATLRYGFSTLDLDSIPNNLEPTKQYRFGDELFLEIQKQGDYYRATGLWRTPPQQGLFLKTRVEHHNRRAPFSKKRAAQPERASGSISLRGGIEEYFTNTATAQRLDSLIAARGTDTTIHIISVVMLARDGTARIKDVYYTENR